MSVASEQNPFVGLRPFESSESLLFFGRQTQILELLQRLHDHHFVGVIGSSGSGKSSLIRAGLIPRLKAGYLVDERDQWLLSIFKPGESPLYNFIFALFSELKQDNSKPAIDKFLNKVKEQGADAVIEVIKKHISDNRTNLFILVDQFEELFRFSVESEDAEKRNEAIDFVNILLQIAGRKELPVYIVITMRSDFIGDCALFHGLPEALNTSQYLVPRLTRIELKSVIEGPVRLYGGKINPALTFKLINEVERVKDELPLLQHVLMRVWDYESKTDKNGELDLDDY
jgi:energy-coupling factor transporter ATP-binding protein EcfA2